MPVKSKKQPSMVGLSARQMRRKPISTEHLIDIKPMTSTQEKVFEEYDKEKNLFLYGCAGTGCLLYTSPSPRDVEESRMPSSA